MNHTMESTLLSDPMKPTQTITSRQISTSLVSELALALGRSPSIQDNANPLALASEEIKNILLTLYAAFPTELPAALDLLDRRLILRFRVLDYNDGQHDKGPHISDRSERCGLDDTNPARLSHSNAAVDTFQAHDDPSSVCLQDSAPTGRTEAPSADRVSYNPEVAGMSVNHSVRPVSKAHVSNDNAGSVVRGLYYVKSAQQQNASRARWRDEDPSHYEVRLIPWSCSCPAFIFSAFPPTTLQRPNSPVGEGSEHSFGGVSLDKDISLCKHLLASYLVDKCPQLDKFVEERAVSIAELAGWAAGWGD